MKNLTLLFLPLLIQFKFFAQSSDKPIVNQNVIFKEKNGLVAVEAEHFYKQTNDQIRRWYINSATQKPNVRPDLDDASFEDASNKTYIEVLPDNFFTLEDPIIDGENLGLKAGQMAVVHYKILFTKAGRYYVWTRMRTNDEEDNTCHIGIDGKWAKTGEILQFQKKQQKWVWNNKIRNKVPAPDGQRDLALIEVSSAGVHDIMFSMREDGFEFDKFILTTDSTFQKPEGVGAEILLHEGKLPKTTISSNKKTFLNPDNSFYGAKVVYQEKDGSVAFEAENFYKQTNLGNRMWHLVSETFESKIGPDSDPNHFKNASGNAYLEVLPDARQKDEDAINNKSSISDKPNQQAVLYYPIHFTQPGKFFVWIRGFGVDGDDNTLHVGIDTLSPESGKRVHFNKMKEWTWICNQRNTKQKIWIDVPTKGVHFLTLSMREDGCEIDRILLSNDENFVPNDSSEYQTNFKKGTLDEWLKNREILMKPQSIYQEKEGILVMEIENTFASTGWQYLADSSKHSGYGYLEWKKEGQGKPAGEGLLTFDFEIKESGNYQFFMRSKMKEPSNRPETLDPDGNDVWLKFVGGKEVENQTELGEKWNKIAILGHPKSWTFSTNADKGKPHPDSPVCRFFEAGKYQILISGRSQGHAIDKLILKKFKKNPLVKFDEKIEAELNGLMESEKQ